MHRRRHRRRLGHRLLLLLRCCLLRQLGLLLMPRTPFLFSVLSTTGFIHFNGDMIALAVGIGPPLGGGGAPLETKFSPAGTGGYWGGGGMTPGALWAPGCCRNDATEPAAAASNDEPEDI